MDVAFRIVEPGRFAKTDPLPEGMVAFDKNGTGLFHVADLQLVGIGGRVIVLADNGGTLRVALRKVRGGEESKAAKVAIVKRGDSDSGRRCHPCRAAMCGGRERRRRSG